MSGEGKLTDLAICKREARGREMRGQYVLQGLDGGELETKLTFVELDAELGLDERLNVQVHLVEVGCYTIRHDEQRAVREEARWVRWSGLGDIR